MRLRRSPSAAQRFALHRVRAFALADELGDGDTGYLIERALDEVRSRQFRLAGRLD